VDQNNHALDVDRYITIETFHSHEQRQPVHNTEEKKKSREPESTVDFERRIRINKSEGHYEDWS
jgi:hypothetical protein